MDLEKDHCARVEAVASQVRERIADGEPVHVHKGGVHHVVPLPGDPRFRSRPIDVSGLNRILSIDREARVCDAEPGVRFAELVEATLREGLLPVVVPELEGITVGGAVAGCSIESMSFRHGGFHDGCLEYEIVTGSGEVVSCSPEREPFLFEMIHGSYGTLGILTRLRFRLVPAKPFVHLVYRRFSRFEAFQRELLARCQDGDFDFVDGIVHAPDCLVLCLGRFAAEAPRTSDYTGTEIYWRSTRERDEDWLGTRDYCFRYDTECHWLTRTFPPLEWKPVRRLLGPALLGSTNLIRWSGLLEPLLRLKRRPDVVVDVFVPERRWAEFHDWYLRDFDFFPLWIVPYRPPRVYPWVAEERGRELAGQLLIDCAVYGKANSDPRVDYSELLERKVDELGGLKTLISRNHYDEKSFWQVYHRENVEAAKAVLDPKGVFPGLFEKLHRVG
jgi:FAD/FMN-containing dehydrogenase